MSCLFCQIIAGELPASKVYEDELAVAFMDLFPVNPGHLLVVPKQHVGQLHEMDEGIGAHLFRVAMRLERALRRTDVRCEGTNILQNNGDVAMQAVFHVHLHVIPRYRGDSVRFYFGHQKPSRHELDEMAAIIREQLAENRG